MLISYKIQTLNFTEDINELLCRIDRKISTISKTKLDSLRYGVQNCHKSQDYSILVKYRQILTAKAVGDFCLKDYLIDDIISNIKQYLTVGKIQKFKKSPAITQQSPNAPGTNAVQINLNYSYNDAIVHRNACNMFIDPYWK